MTKGRGTSVHIVDTKLYKYTVYIYNLYFDFM